MLAKAAVPNPMIPCDPCQAITAENKLLKYFIAYLMESQGIDHAIVPINEHEDIPVHWRPTTDTRSWHLTVE